MPHRHHCRENLFSSHDQCLYSKWNSLPGTSIGNQAHSIPQVGLLYLIFRQSCWEIVISLYRSRKYTLPWSTFTRIRSDQKQSISVMFGLELTNTHFLTMTTSSHVETSLISRYLSWQMFKWTEFLISTSPDLHVRFKGLTRLHSLHISFVKKKFHPDMCYFVERSGKDASPITTNLTYSSLNSTIVYSIYPHNMHFLLPLTPIKQPYTVHF